MSPTLSRLLADLPQEEEAWLHAARANGYELYHAIALLRSPTNPSYVNSIALVLVAIYAYGLTRAWELLGGRQYRLGDLLSPLRDTPGDQAATTSKETDEGARRD